ncbi:DMT family transporter [Poseidonibacter ostreae]|uniref:Multidrug resistance efflux transporter family protein n=1 Tax=Poseidonibacter ostreae TaxID=2654171 RepID=A0A6L4WQE1_9BACT|nr:multidrug resistance efflux transporter family protein [Poseidonibacter ostreae]KAB7886105.1 multidrug resistance efflux transporter family protein [Poseidonibacter ostreae]KAB7889809.1 multidrug resistance efflux transporter family protein [Poseidonibacter ostreae]
MFKLIVLGILSGAFFSTTFVLNELMSVQGGHWLYSATLRYFFMILFLAIILLFQGGIKRLTDIVKLFKQNYLFWTISGTIGFGFFYALICFAADFSPGWVIAASWQFTIVATLFVLLFFGKSFPKKIWFFSSLIFIGVCLVNLSHIDNFELSTLIYGGIPVLLASFCYPLGNQLIWESQNGSSTKVPHIKSSLLKNSFNKVMLLCLGSIPFWLILLLIIQPSAPSSSQVLNSSLVALFSGVFATTIFLYARGIAKDSNEIAAVDATQASEVIFAMLGGFLLFGTISLSSFSIIGLVLIMLGLFLFIKYQNKT